MAHKTLLLAFTLIATSTVMCQDFDEHSVVRQEQEEKKEVEHKQEIPALSYYSTHLATALVTKFLLDEFVAVVNSHSLCPDESLTEKCAILLAMYIFYRVPQWTDNAIGIEEKRSFLSNVFSCMTRLMIPFPVGTLASEFVIRQDS